MNLANEWDAIGASPTQGKQPALAEEWDNLKPVETPKKAAEVPEADKPGKLLSLGAGAGEAVGRGALAIQQLLGKGVSALGDVADVDALKSAGGWLEKDASQGVKKLAAENAPYEAANPKTNMAGQLIGFVGSPVNKLVPGGGAPSSVLGAMGQGAAQGAALSALTQPVTDEKSNFLVEKAKQATVGALGGAAGGAAGYGLAQGFNKTLEIFRKAGNKVTANPAAAESIVADAIKANGGDPAAIKAARPELFDSFKTQVADALKSGEKVNSAALKRLTESQTLPVPVPMLKGQITRDAMQFAKEQNLRGITGIGEPITQTLKAQNRALIDNLDALGAEHGTDIVSAGKSAIDILKASDKATSSHVSKSYEAFKNATGKELDVPLTGLAQDYPKTLKEFGDAIPSAIRSKFEELGLQSGTAKKVFSIEDAEGLIKSINRNYDPKNVVQARALDELRGAVQKAISEGAGSSAEGTSAAVLAKAARAAAKERFGLIEQTPALKAAINNEQPDAFIHNFILQGNTAEIRNMMRSISEQDPRAAEGLRNSLMSYIKGRVLNNQSSENGVFSQAQLKQFVSDPRMSSRIKEVLGAERFALLKQLNSVAENALYAPKAAAVNTSNTASAAANLVKEEVKGGSLNSLLDIAKKVPILATPAQMSQEAYQGARASGMVNEAVNPSIAQRGNIPLRNLLLFERAGAGALQERNRRAAQK